MERGQDGKLFAALVGFADLGDTEAVPGGVPKDISDRQRAFGRNQSHSFLGFFRDIHLGECRDELRHRIIEFEFALLPSSTLRWIALSILGCEGSWLIVAPHGLMVKM
jgi:hypothetical protein